MSILQKLNLEVLKQKHPWSSLLWPYLYILVLFPVFPYCKLRPGTGPGPGPAPPPAPPQPRPLVCAKKSHDSAPGCCRPPRLPAHRDQLYSHLMGKKFQNIPEIADIKAAMVSQHALVIQNMKKKMHKSYILQFVSYYIPKTIFSSL